MGFSDQFNGTKVESTAPTAEVAVATDENALTTEQAVAVIDSRGSVKVINNNSEYRDFSAPPVEAIPEVAETIDVSEPTPIPATEEGEGFLDVMAAEEPAQEVQPEPVVDTEKTQDSPVETEVNVPIEEPQPMEEVPPVEEVPADSEKPQEPPVESINEEVVETSQKTEKELIAEQNKQIMDFLYENHKNAFIKPEGKNYIILKDSKNRILDINNGKLIEETGDNFSRYTYVFSEKGVSMAIKDERIYDKDNCSNLDEIVNADFSTDKSDKFVKVPSDDGQRYFTVNVRNCKNIDELDKEGIKGIVEFVDAENPIEESEAKTEEQIEAETASLKSFFAETDN